MRRTQFFVVLAVVGLIFAAAMILVPQGFARFSRLESSPATEVALRALGVMILALSLLDWLVRRDDDSPTLAAVLWSNLVVHGLTPVVDLLGVAQGVMPLRAALPGVVIHLLLAWGCFVFASRIRRA